MPHSSVLLPTSTGLAQSLYLKLFNRVKAIVMNEIQFVSKSYLYPKLKSWLNLQRSSPFVGWCLVFSISFLWTFCLHAGHPKDRRQPTVCHTWQKLKLGIEVMTIGHISTSHFSLIIAPFHWSHFSHHGFRPMRLSDQIAFILPLSHLSTYLNLYPHETASKAHSLLVIWIPPFYFQVFPLFSIFNFSFSRRLLYQYLSLKK